MSRLELLDIDDESAPVVWTGTIEEFEEANADCPLEADERDALMSEGSVVVGGGAVPMFVVRFAQKPADVDHLSGGAR